MIPIRNIQKTKDRRQKTKGRRQKTKDRSKRRKTDKTEEDRQERRQDRQTFKQDREERLRSCRLYAYVRACIQNNLGCVPAYGANTSHACISWMFLQNFFRFLYIFCFLKFYSVHKMEKNCKK